MGKIEARITVDYFDLGVVEELSRSGVFFFSVTSLGIQHDPRLYAPAMGCDHCIQHAWIREQEHLDTQRFLGMLNRVEQWLRRIVGHDQKRTRHIAFQNTLPRRSA